MEIRLRPMMIGMAWAALALAAVAQVEPKWIQLNDGQMMFDFAHALGVDAAGRTIVTGQSYLLTSGPMPVLTTDVRTVAYDSAGNLLWAHTEDAGGWDTSTAVVVSLSGEVYVVGQTGSAQLAIKYDANGTKLWTRTYPGINGPSFALSACIDAAGNVFMGGGAPGPNGDGDMCVRKLDPNGNVLWTALRDGHQGNDSVSKILLAPNGDIVAAGVVNIPNPPDTHLAAMRVDPAGNVMWLRELGIHGEYVGDVAVDPNGVAYVAGRTTSPPPIPVDGDMALAAWDASGNLLWSRIIDGGSNEEFTRVAVDPRGRVVATAFADHAGTRGDFVTYVFDAAGNEVWHQTFDAAAHLDDYPQALAIDAFGNIHVAGYSYLAPNISEAVVVGYDPYGVEHYVWHQTGGPGASAVFTCVQLAGEEIILAGHEQISPADYDYLTARIRRTVIPYCFGDGSGSACPCGNTDVASWNAGCASSLGIGGRLIDSGASSLAADTLVLLGTNMPSSSALYFQGTVKTSGGAGSIFGDGLRCVSGAIVRLGTKLNAMGVSQYPEPGDASVSMRGGVMTSGERFYQAWYRNAAPFCTNATFNLTNGLRVIWVP
jgi:outer membrane protein assembly factor BamB